MELVQMLPEMVLALKGAFRFGSLGAQLKLVRLEVLVVGTFVTAKDTLGFGTTNAPHCTRFLRVQGDIAYPGVKAR